MNADLNRKAGVSGTERLLTVRGGELRPSSIECLMLSAFIGVHRRHQYAVG
jgi:hypothetical protein